MTLTDMLAWLALVAASGCGGAMTGERVARVPTAAAAVAVATTHETAGLRVLANQPSRRGGPLGAWLARDEGGLAALWDATGAPGPRPRVDFGAYVVLGTAFEGGVCEPEIAAAQLDAEGTLSFRTEPSPPNTGCIALLARVARVVAVPRRLLPRRFTWSTGADTLQAFAFELPPASPGLHAAPSVSNARGSAERAFVAVARGTVALPSPGHLALRELDDGREVWVVHRADDGVSVLAADVGDGSLHAPVAWDAAAGRFSTAHDAHGRSVRGGPALPTLAFARADATHVVVGDATPSVPGGPIEPPRDAPALDGPAAPYASQTPVAPDLATLPEGHLVRVAGELVTGLSGPTRLCVLPMGKLRAHIRGCPDDAPALAGSASSTRRGLYAVDGPMMVRRLGRTIDLAVAGPGMSAWVVEHPLAPPAAHGATRSRGTLGTNTDVRGDTAGARDGYAPSCVAAAGSPDESWDLVAPSDGAYAIELTSRYDGALAVLAQDGTVLACNDDRHGYERSSIVHVALARGARVRVVVDGFGGASGAYVLRASPEAALAHGGVLVAGVEVAGDTSRATDDHSEGCYAPARDQAYRFVVDAPARFEFRVDTPGWHPLLSVVREDSDRSVGCGVGPGPTPPLRTRFTLEAGAYRVVVDGSDAREVGPYRLRVDRAAP